MSRDAKHDKHDRRDKRESAIKRAQDTEGVLCQTHIGGQALIEGVMMRGKYNWAAAVRTPKGDIYIEDHDLPTRPDKHGWLYWPVVRGCRALVESLLLGYKALEVAADNAFDFDEEGEEPVGAIDGDAIDAGDAAAELASEAAVVSAGGAAAENASEAESTSDDGSESKAALIIGTILGVTLGLAAFIMLPAFLTNLVMGDYNNNPIVWNVVDGAIRVAIFILYIWAISFMKDIKRMFRYHGAEHKTIHCFEHGLELTPENAQQFTTLHVRCGTAFMIMTLILAIIVFSVAPVKEVCAAMGLVEGPGQFLVIVLSRIVLIPVVAGLGYELTVKWAGAHPEKKLVKIVLWPGLQMQKLTTAEPDDSMLECAIAAMKKVLEREELEARRASGGVHEPDSDANAPADGASGEGTPGNLAAADAADSDIVTGTAETGCPSCPTAGPALVAGDVLTMTACR